MRPLGKPVLVALILPSSVPLGYADENANAGSGIQVARGPDDIATNGECVNDGNHRTCDKRHQGLTAHKVLSTAGAPACKKPAGRPRYSALTTSGTKGVSRKTTRRKSGGARGSPWPPCWLLSGHESPGQFKIEKQNGRTDRD